MRDTTLLYGPDDDSTAALIEFKKQVTRHLANARRRAQENEFWARMVAVYAADLEDVEAELRDRLKG